MSKIWGSDRKSDWIFEISSVSRDPYSDTLFNFPAKPSWPCKKRKSQIWRPNRVASKIWYDIGNQRIIPVSDTVFNCVGKIRVAPLRKRKVKFGTKVRIQSKIWLNFLNQRFEIPYFDTLFNFINKFPLLLRRIKIWIRGSNRGRIENCVRYS